MKILKNLKAIYLSLDQKRNPQRAEKWQKPVNLLNKKVLPRFTEKRCPNQYLFFILILDLLSPMCNDVTLQCTGSVLGLS